MDELIHRIKMRLRVAPCSPRRCSQDGWHNGHLTRWGRRWLDRQQMTVIKPLG